MRTRWKEKGMYKADVWIWTDSRYWKKSPKIFYYSVEGMYKGEPLLRYGKTQDKEGKEKSVDATWDRITLMGIAKALNRFEINAEVTIHCMNQGVLSSIVHDLERWKGNGFIRSDKKEVQNADLWREIAKKSNMLKLVTEHLGLEREDELRAHVFAKEREEYESERSSRESGSIRTNSGDGTGIPGE